METVKSVALTADDDEPEAMFMVIFPVDALIGTTAVMLVSDQDVHDAFEEPIITVELPCASPKPVPETVIELPTYPESGEKPVIEGPPVVPLLFIDIPLTDS